MKISEILPNPNNPRLIKDDKFKKLVKSIQEFPKMMALRPMVIDENNIVLGGNMRLRALKELGFKEVPEEWAKRLTKDYDVICFKNGYSKGAREMTIEFKGYEIKQILHPITNKIETVFALKLGQILETKKIV